MKNRIIGIIILIFIFGGGYFYYYYFFKINKGNITLKGNISNYEVSLFNEDFKVNLKSNCKISKCELIDLAPFKYDLKITKEGYKQYEKIININPRNTIFLDFILEKDLIIKKIQEEKIDINIENKINNLREISNVLQSYKYFNKFDLGYFYFIQNNDDTLSLWRKVIGEKDSFILNINQTDKNLLNIEKIEGQKSSIFIKTNDYIYIYDTNTGKIDSINFPQKINYIKRNNGDFILVNDKGSFIYNTLNEKIEYFYIFKDFISIDNQTYFGIIYKNEIDKKNNLGIKDNSGNLLVKYNFIEKKVSILKVIDFKVDKISRENDNIYIYDNNNNKYLIENID